MKNIVNILMGSYEIGDSICEMDYKRKRGEDTYRDYTGAKVYELVKYIPETIQNVFAKIGGY